MEQLEVGKPVTLRQFVGKLRSEPRAEESGEADKPDTSDAEEEEEKIEDGLDEEEDDSSSEEEEEEEEQKSKKKPSDAEAKYLDAEEKRKKTQSILDRERNQHRSEMNELRQELNEIKQSMSSSSEQQRTNEIEQLLAQIQDDGYVEGKLAKDLVKALRQPVKQTVKKQNQPAQHDPKKFREWVVGLDDGAELDNFFTQNRSVVEQRMNTIPTDNPYARAQEMRVAYRDEIILSLTEELKSTKKALKKAKKTGNKPRVPATGPGGRNLSRDTGTGKQPQTLTEYFSKNHRR